MPHPRRRAMRSRIGPCWLLLAAACGGSNPTSGGGGPQPTVQAISMGEYSFSPKDVTIKAGTIVKWSNVGTLDHTTTSDSPGWDSGPLAPPQPDNSCTYPPCGTTPGATFS